MLTINAEVVKNQRKTNDCFTVRLRFTLDRKMKRLATSLFATPKDLTKDLKIKQSSPHKREVDCLIRACQKKCAKLQIELNHYTLGVCRHQSPRKKCRQFVRYGVEPGRL